MILNRKRKHKEEDSESSTLIEPDPKQAEQLSRARQELARMPESVPRSTRRIGRLPWSVGTKVGRTIYDADHNLIGMMDCIEMAVAVVTARNAFPPSREVPQGEGAPDE